ncbi:hypothetical protein ACOMHN_059898 [Nucella lapillus]
MATNSSGPSSTAPLALSRDGSRSSASPGGTTTTTTGMNGEKQKSRLENILFKLKKADPEDGSPCALSSPASPDPGSEGSGDLGITTNREGLSAGSEGQKGVGDINTSNINRRSSRKPTRRERGSQSMERHLGDSMNDSNDAMQTEGGEDTIEEVYDQQDQGETLPDAVRVKIEREDGEEWPGVFNKMPFSSDLFPEQQEDELSVCETFTCEKCGDMFPTLHELDTHIDTHIKQETKDFSVYPCGVCGKCFANEDYLSRHVTTHDGEVVEEQEEPAVEENVYLPGDTSGPTYKCDHCRRMFYTDDDFQQHKCMKGRMRPFGCGRCGRSYSQLSILKNHLSLHEKGLTTDLECFQCGQKFMYSIELRRHMNIHIKADLTAALVHQSSSKLSAATATSTSLSATANGDGAADGDSHTSLKLKIPLSRLMSKKKTKVKTANKVKIHACQVCQKVFHRRSSLCMHMRIHSEKKFECSYCSKMFTFKKSMEIHVRSHTGEKPYHCSFCTKSFTRQDTLHKHEKIHLGVKPYVCETCGRQYCDKFDLQRHSHSHTQDKPYKCTLCSKAYTEKKRLKEHMFFHSGDMPFVCDLCGKGFARKYRYDHHLSQHTGEVRFHCECCNKGFYRRSDLNSHMETHSSKKPFTCETCGAGFLRESYLRRHSIVHCSEKPHRCHLCGKGFARKSTLRRHVMIHKRNNEGVEVDYRQAVHGRYSHYTADFGCGISGSVAPMTGSNPEERDIMKDIQAVIGLGDDVNVFE